MFTAPPTFLETPPAIVEVRDQDTLSLTCTAVGNPQPVVIWKRSDLAVQSGDTVQVRMANHRLFPWDVSPTSAGVSWGSQARRAMRLCLAGEQASIPTAVACTTSHQPCPQHHVPESVVSLGGRAMCLLPLQVRNGTLSIAVVERASAGTYTCHASSKEGTITHTTRVLVQGKSGHSPSPGHLGHPTGCCRRAWREPHVLGQAQVRQALGAAGSVPCPQPSPSPLPHTAGPPVIVVPPQNITVNISQDAFLACQAEAYPGNLTYTWFQGSSNVFHLRYSRDGDGTKAATGSCWQ